MELTVLTPSDGAPCFMASSCALRALNLSPCFGWDDNDELSSANSDALISTISASTSMTLLDLRAFISFPVGPVFSGFGGATYVPDGDPVAGSGSAANFCLR